MKQFRRAVIRMISFSLLLLGCQQMTIRAEQVQTATETEVTQFLAEQTADFEQRKEPVFPLYMSVAGKDIGGMTYAELEEWVEEYTENCMDRHVTLTVLGNNYEYEMNNFGIEWENKELVKELKAYLPQGNFVERYLAQKDMQAAPVEKTIDFSIDEEVVSQTVNDYVNHFTCAMENARVVKVEGGFQVVEAIIGRSFDAEAITSELIQKMTEYDETETLIYDFPHVDTEPQYRGDSFNFTFSILGEYTTGAVGTGGRRNNVIKSAQGINGKVLFPGEEFSALNWYGEVTEANGYMAAPTYMDGRQIPGIGGGICQTTTTLYDALLYAELGIKYRAPHSMLVAYTPPSMDAMVDYATGADFIAYNNKDYPVYFEAAVNGDRLTIRVWGNETRPANRQIRYEHQILSLQFPDPLYDVITVNDQVCKVGAYYVGEKLYEEVAPHPTLSSKLIKTVLVDGQIVEQTVVNPEHRTGNNDGYDDYAPMRGVLYYASDCVVKSELINDPNTWLGQRIHHDVRFPNGETWNEFEYAENMQ